MVALNQNRTSAPSASSAVNARSRALFPRRGPRGYQSNWLTVHIGAKWWALSAARLYDFATGRFTQRDPLPSLVKGVGGASGNALGLFVRTSLAGQVYWEAYRGHWPFHGYVFAASCPVALVDSFGLNPQPVKGARGDWSFDGGRPVKVSYALDSTKHCCDRYILVQVTNARAGQNLGIDWQFPWQIEDDPDFQRNEANRTKRPTHGTLRHLWGMDRNPVPKAQQRTSAAFGNAAEPNVVPESEAKEGVVHMGPPQPGEFMGQPASFTDKPGLPGTFETCAICVAGKPNVIGDVLDCLVWSSRGNEEGTLKGSSPTASPDFKDAANDWNSWIDIELDRRKKAGTPGPPPAYKKLPPLRDLK